MGYYAQGSGSITIKRLTEQEVKDFYRRVETHFVWKPVAEEKIPKDIKYILSKIDNQIANIFVLCNNYNENRQLAIEVLYEYGIYSKLVKEELDLIASITESGEINFVGDDNHVWRFHFREGEWHEDNGVVYYSTDEPLTMKMDGSQGVVVFKDGLSMMLCENEIDKISSFFLENTHYRHDVVGYLNTLIEAGELSEDVLEDEKIIKEMVFNYADLREKHGVGSGYVWDWTECIAEAYYQTDTTPYERTI